MSPTQRFYKRLLRQLRITYGEALANVIFKDKTGLEVWDVFRNELETVFRWASVVQAGKIRYRATGEKLEIPGPLEEVTIDDLIEGNPWMIGHSEIIFPIVAQAVDAATVTEAAFAKEKKEAILQNPKSLPMYRLEQIHRNTLGTIVAASDQAQFADPEVGDHFPVGEYCTREDARVRPTHRVMDGFIGYRFGEGLRLWQKFLPPVGPNCRCYVIWRTWPDAVRRGWATDKNKPKWDHRWPNSQAKKNFDNGDYPEWGEPRTVAEYRLPT